MVGDMRQIKASTGPPEKRRKKQELVDISKPFTHKRRDASNPSKEYRRANDRYSNAFGTKGCLEHGNKSGHALLSIWKVIPYN
jgi:hypothetical protein